MASEALLATLVNGVSEQLEEDRLYNTALVPLNHGALPGVSNGADDAQFNSQNMPTPCRLLSATPPSLRHLNHGATVAQRVTRAELETLKGLFIDINRAYCTIDHAFYIWNFLDGCAIPHPLTPQLGPVRV